VCLDEDVLKMQIIVDQLPLGKEMQQGHDLEKHLEKLSPVRVRSHPVPQRHALDVRGLQQTNPSGVGGTVRLQKRGSLVGGEASSDLGEDQARGERLASLISKPSPEFYGTVVSTLIKVGHDVIHPRRRVVVAFVAQKHGGDPGLPFDGTEGCYGMHATS
jgi:hypothetical protein